MLEQRRAQEKGYITLKEAAQISNYSPDYIGQLIRSGKIRGEQVYSNVAWVTTEDELRAYMQNKTRAVTSRSEAVPFVGALSERLFSYALYTLIAIFSLFILVLQYILYVTVDEAIEARHTATVIVEERS